MTGSTGWSGKVCCWLILFSLLGPVAVLYGADQDLAASRSRLAALEKKIETTLADLHAKRSEVGSLDRELAALQAEMQKVERMVRRSTAELQELDARIDSRRQAHAQLEATQRHTEQQVGRRLVALYRSGEIGMLKVLLSTEESLQALLEKFEFLSRMVRHDRQLISDYREQALALRQSLDELQALRGKQEAVVERRRAEQQALKSAQATSQRLLARVRKDEQLLNQVLADLRERAARLNELVKKLETEQTPSYTGSLTGLAAQKGRLPWPVDGPVRVGFGKNRHGELGTLIESHGLEIAAPVGAAVASIAPGKILFAKPLRGFGNLLIIDHGNKDYSLYAHVARFVKKVDDQVAAGELIAYSGYEDRDYIYFEIRHGGQPLDPAAWLKPR